MEKRGGKLISVTENSLSSYGNFAVSGSLTGTLTGGYSPLNNIDHTPKEISEMNEILNYGLKESEGIKRISNDLISFYDSESEKFINNVLTRLHSATENFGVARGFIPWVAKKTNLKFNFNVSEKDLLRGKEVIDGIIKELDNNLNNIKTDIANIDDLINSLKSYYNNLNKTIETIDNKIKEELDKTFDNNISVEQSKEKVRMLEQKKLDLIESQKTSEIIAAQLQMLKSNNFDLYSLLSSKIVSRVPTLLASVTVKTISNRGRRTLANIKSFDKGSDNLLKNNIQEINTNIKETINHTIESRQNRFELLENIKADILSTTIEVKNMKDCLIEKQKEDLRKIENKKVPPLLSGLVNNQSNFTGPR